jgi:hypothetical protein
MTLEEVREEGDREGGGGGGGDDDSDDDLPLMEKKQYPPLPAYVTLSYALGEVGPYVCSTIENLFLPSFLLEVASLAASKVPPLSLSFLLFLSLSLSLSPVPYLVFFSLIFQTGLILLIAQLYNAFVGPFGNANFFFLYFSPFYLLRVLSLVF